MHVKPSMFILFKKSQKILSLSGIQEKVSCCYVEDIVCFKRVYFDFLHNVSHITTCKFLGLERKHIAYLGLLLETIFVINVIIYMCLQHSVVLWV